MLEKLKKTCSGSYWHLEYLFGPDISPRPIPLAVADNDVTQTTLENGNGRGRRGNGLVNSEQPMETVGDGIGEEVVDVDGQSGEQSSSASRQSPAFRPLAPRPLASRPLAPRPAPDRATPGPPPLQRAPPQPAPRAPSSDSEGEEENNNLERPELIKYLDLKQKRSLNSQEEGERKRMKVEEDRRRDDREERREMFERELENRVQIARIQAEASVNTTAKNAEMVQNLGAILAGLIARFDGARRENPNN